MFPETDRPDSLLSQRLARNLNRFSLPEYSSEAVRDKDTYSWPGDYRGRLLLALAMHARCEADAVPRLRALLDETLRLLAPVGYFVCPEQTGGTDEQQLAGHSWLMRGLLCAYEALNEPAARAAAVRLFENLYLPCKNAFSLYPTQERNPRLAGEAIGEIDSAASGEWLLSTDTGCVFIALDGLTDYYRVTGDPGAIDLIRPLVRKYREFDCEKIKAQTHATLTALRALVRLYTLEPEEELLAFVRTRFQAYLDRAMTSNYANFNWFGRPEWTEPCAIIDAFMLAHQLYRITDDTGYLEIARRTYYNGVLASQRANGGFGCDCCVRPDGPQCLSTSEGLYEAFWCCSMRGAEGLVYAREYSVLESRDAVAITLFSDGGYRTGPADLELRTLSGSLQIRVRKVSRPFQLKISLPEGLSSPLPDGCRLENGFVICPVTGDTDLILTPDSRITEEVKDGKKRYFRGSILLGGESRQTLRPLYTRFDRSREELLREKLRILF